MKVFSVFSEGVFLFLFLKASRIALLHSLANIEQWAIDLSWDVIVRFATVRLQNGEQLPREFFNDFVKVAGDEAKVGVPG